MMWDLFLARLSKRTCPWCRVDRKTPINDWFSDHLPYRMWAGLKIGSWDYNGWVGKVGIRLHGRHW